MFTESTIEYQFEREKRRVCAYDREKLVGVCLVEDAGVFLAIRHINVDASYDPREIVPGLLRYLYCHALERRIKIDNLSFVPLR